MECRPCGWWVASAVYWRSRARALRAEVANAEAMLSDPAETDEARQAVESERERIERLEQEAREAGAMPDWLH